MILRQEIFKKKRQKEKDIGVRVIRKKKNTQKKKIIIGLEIYSVFKVSSQRKMISLNWLEKSNL